MTTENLTCLINESDCGRVAGNPVCPKCGMDDRVVYPGQADLEQALHAAKSRYLYKASENSARPRDLTCFDTTGCDERCVVEKNGSPHELELKQSTESMGAILPFIMFSAFGVIGMLTEGGFQFMIPAILVIGVVFACIALWKKSILAYIPVLIVDLYLMFSYMMSLLVAVWDKYFGINFESVFVVVRSIFTSIVALGMIGGILFYFFGPFLSAISCFWYRRAKMLDDEWRQVNS